MWEPGEDKFVFRVHVNLTLPNLKKKAQTLMKDLSTDDIPRLPKCFCQSGYYLDL